ncbi:MAG TPA: NUDIX hydrolase [Verrucomicrobiae bacterium]|nr:NUDIX hydrolase [Verrucomicrobiae bacterium]
MAQTAPDEVVFSTKWFQILARKSPGSSDPHYLIDTTDFVSLVVLNRENKLLLVRQFRPAVNRMTLEVPSGHVEAGETPEDTAHRELLEETGHVVEKFDLMATVSPAIGRFTNSMWCYFASNARPSNDPKHEVEAGIELVAYDGSVRALVGNEEFYSSLGYAAIFAAMARGRISLGQ